MDLRVSLHKLCAPTCQSLMPYRWGTSVIIPALFVITSEGFSHQREGVTRNSTRTGQSCWRRPARGCAFFRHLWESFDLGGGPKAKFWCLMVCLRFLEETSLGMSTGNVVSTSSDFRNTRFLAKNCHVLENLGPQLGSGNCTLRVSVLGESKVHRLYERFLWVGVSGGWGTQSARRKGMFV